MPPKPAEDTTLKAHWIKAETTMLIDDLIAKKSMHQSGNGWKPSVWAGIIMLVGAANPNASPKKDQTKYISKINYAHSTSTPAALKEKFEVYLFVKKYSEIGWDDEDHHATVTEEVIKTFLEHTTSAAESTLIHIPSLSVLCDEMVNKATGEHVVHLGNPAKKKHKSKKASDPSTTSTLTVTPNPTTMAPNSTTTTTMTAAAAGNNDTKRENEIIEIDGVEDSTGVGGKDNSCFDDELILSPHTKASRKHAHVINEDEDDDNGRSHKQKKSDSSSHSGITHCNAEAGTQITRSVDAETS
ncbi:hypothetical protein DFH08DRAFT_973459 [Mycena albidolilacea]|uniref:Myb/SANT-like domain-containing protein n=1 Tax=Mycena albidolilacea TaxID=1033008 RepID=A0AAD6Z9C8_9AGAR|nr:hypothetical protein DFH08DRAFT_973459 [Mycena albidolilacea]